MASGGAAAVRGFDYQIEASIWVTLELLLRNRRATSVEIEPVNSEDMQADLRPEDTPGDLLDGAVRVVHADGYRALYQMKTRGTGPWTVATLSSVLGDGLARAPRKRGPIPRKLATELLLGDRKSLYFLITDAYVEQSLFPISDEKLRFDPSEAPVPSALLAPAVKHRAQELQGRISILPATTRELIHFRTLQLLNDVAMVPQVRLQGCLDSLTAAVRSRVGRYCTDPFSYEDLAKILHQHGGLPDGPRRFFVPPANIDHIRERLDRENAMLLIGPPGVGKTVLADYLATQYQTETPPYRYVTVSSQLDRLKDVLAERGPAFILVPDPWGSSRPGQGGLLTHELADLISGTSSDKKIIVTTRRDIYANVPIRHQRLFERYVQAFSEADYDADGLWRIVTVHAELRPQQLELIRPYKARIIKTLRLPAALKRFGQLLKDAAGTLDTHINPWGDYDPVFEEGYFDDNSQKVEALIQQAGEEVHGGHTAEILTGWKDLLAQHVALFWLLCDSGGPVLLDSFLELARGMHTRFGTELQVQRFAEFLAKTNIAQLHHECIEIHSFSLEPMAELAQDGSAANTQFVMNLACVSLDQDGEYPIYRVDRAIEMLYRFGADFAACAGWPRFVQQIDGLIEDACSSPDKFTFDTGVTLAFSWRWPASRFVVFVAALAPDDDVASRSFPAPEQLVNDKAGPRRDQAAEFLRKFFLHYVPSTSRSFSNQSVRFVRLMRALDLTLDAELRRSLRALEVKHSHLYERNAYEHDENYAFMLEVLQATSDRPYMPRLIFTATEPERESYNQYTRNSS